MASGFVYLKPTEVVFFRVRGARNEAAHKAWELMNAWLDKYSLRGDIDVGYGLYSKSSKSDTDGYYDACVKIPAFANANALRELKAQRLPGGAYARQRHNGSHRQIPGLLQRMRDEWSHSKTLKFDPCRPVLEIYLNDPQKVVPEKLRTDLCLPVSAEAFGCAA